MRARPRNALLLDLYELTMAAGYVRQGMESRAAVFDLYFRTAPFQGSYAVFAGLEPALEDLESLTFDTADVEYLRGLELFDGRFLEYLRGFRFEGRVTAVAEGDLVFANEPLLTVEAPLAAAQLVETALLNRINFETLVATKAARITGAAQGAAVAEYGARRAQGPDGALSASRASRIGGVGGTSQVGAGRAFGIPVVGTQAHSWIMAFPDELTAFRAYASVFPDHCVLLVDTYDTLQSGVPNAITVGRELASRGNRLRGIRLDSGDLAYLSREARRMLDDAGFPDVEILASNELDEHVIESIRSEGGRVDAYGVGTRLVTADGPGGGALGGIYKLVELDGLPRIKVSSDRGKSTIPGRKRLWRVWRGDAGVRMDLDLLSGFDEVPGPVDRVFDPANPLRSTRIAAGARIEDLRTVVMEHGTRTRPAPTLEAIAEFAARRLAQLPDGCRRLLNPHLYRVALTSPLRAQRDRMIEERVERAERDREHG